MNDIEKFITECEKNAVPDTEIDTTDISEWTDADFDKGSFKYWKPRKKLISFRIDLDLLQWLKATSEGSYQQRINSIIRQTMYNSIPSAHKENQQDE